jgi:molybdate transport system ATP-binding protein
VRCELAGEVPLVADVTATAFAELGLAPGVEVWATVKASEVAVYAR